MFALPPVLDLLPRGHFHSAHDIGDNLLARTSRLHPALNLARVEEQVEKQVEEQVEELVPHLHPRRSHQTDLQLRLHRDFLVASSTEEEGQLRLHPDQRHHELELSWATLSQWRSKAVLWMLELLVRAELEPSPDQHHL